MCPHERENVAGDFAVRGPFGNAVAVDGGGMAAFAVVFLGKVEGHDLARHLLIEVVWVLVLLILTRWLYNRGLRHYSAFGG